MREKDLLVLEFDKIRETLKTEALSEPGKRFCLKLVPGHDRETIDRELEEVEQCLDLLRLGVRIPLEGFPDIHSWMAEVQAEGSFLEGKKLVAILFVLRLALRLRTFLADLKEPHRRLAGLRSSLYRIPSMETAIDRSLEESGEVKSNASPELHVIRRRIADIRSQLVDRLNRLLRSRELASLVSDPVVTLRNNRYVVPVPAGALHQVAGVVQDRSASGRTCFVEPLFAVDLNNGLLLARREEREEEIRILEKLTALVREKRNELEQIFSTLVRMDVIHAKARLALRLEAVRPAMGEDDIVLEKTRHPLLVLAGKHATPIDLLIPGRKRGLIVTGPNAGGKTVALKTLGLLAVMAQAGLLIPAGRGARLPLFRAVYTDMAEEQDIEKSLSTFSAHLLNLKEIYGALTLPALIILDELGSGTDPIEGSALGISILQNLLRKGAYLAVATHLRPIKLLGLTDENFQIASVEFDSEALAPRFRLVYKSLGESMALKIARMLDFPEEILSQAERTRPEQDREMGAVLERIREIKVDEDRQLSIIRKERETLENLRQEQQALVRELTEKKQKRWAKELEGAEEFLRSLKREGEAFLKELKESPAKQRLEAFLASKRREVERREMEFGPGGAAEEVKVGDQAEVMKTRWEGRVVGFAKEGGVVLEGDQARITVPPSKLKRTDAPKEERIRFHTESTDPPAELDLRGLKVEEAVRETERYLDQAIRSRHARVKLIHGLGTGALKSALQDYLASSPYCESFRSGERNEGGAGVTWVDLAREEGT